MSWVRPSVPLNGFNCTMPDGTVFTLKRPPMPDPGWYINGQSVERDYFLAEFDKAINTLEPQADAHRST